LFVRAGAIIPTWPEMGYVGQRPLDTLGLDVYPHGQSSFVLYEDDGITYGYLDGKVATTRIECRADGTAVTLTIGARSGAYDGMPERRRFDVQVHRDAAPRSVTMNGTELDAQGWRYDEATKTVWVSVSEDLQRRAPVVIRLA
ncbi:MAG: DUF5110 domain-containing protein, partial [Planctomycetes bacterium]|nr:DUF5110 domain-containing protein [Planctomycetota bacterium]